MYENSILKFVKSCSPITPKSYNKKYHYNKVLTNAI